MATHIQNATIVCPNSAPDISYLISYTATRSNNSQATYKFTIKSLLVGSSNSYFGKGYGLKCTITVNGVSSNVTLKSTSDVWSGGSSSGKVKATDTVSIICTSTTENANQTVKFVVARTDSSTKTTGEVSTSNYYVKSPALLTSKCTAPTSFTVSPAVFENEVTLAWSGAGAGTNNAIKQYRIRYAVSDSDLANVSAWSYSDLKVVTETSYTANLSDKVQDGQYVKFAIRTEGSAGSNYYSYYTYAQTVQKAISDDDTEEEEAPKNIVKFKQDGAWCDGRTYVKQGEVWVECSMKGFTTSI